MVTDAQRKAHQTHAKRMRDAGLAPVTAYLSEAARDALNRLARVHGSKAAALEVLLTGRAPERPKP